MGMMPQGAMQDVTRRSNPLILLGAAAQKVETAMSLRSFHQVDVFATGPLTGNPLAVVANADGLSDEQMQSFARWTNLSETTFLLPPSNPGADYRVRIFTPLRELPFAGHPTLGSAAVWLAEGGRPKTEDIVQDCGAGLVRIRRDGTQFSFAAPPLLRSGTVEEQLVSRVCTGFGIGHEAVEAAEWVDNGPGWMALLLKSHDVLLTLTPDFARIRGLRVGVVAPLSPDEDADFEIRAFTTAGYEDPVTGSLNAGVAQWLIATGRAAASYCARQGTVLNRRGKVSVVKRDDAIWVGGVVRPCVRGHVTL